jgi:hypothetical protein
MVMNINACFFKTLKKLSLVSVGLLLILTSSAQAVLITFDELDQASYLRPGEDEAIAPLTNEYESQGVLFRSSAYLVKWAEPLVPVSVQNYVAGPGFGFEFVGDELPTYVSFYMGSHAQIAVYIDVRGPNYNKQVTSSGEIVGMTDEVGTPYIENEFFSFRSRTGISSVYFGGKADNYIDNLEYTYANEVSVPEPSTFMLFGIGLLGLISSRCRFKFYK